jgi:hypothetical protein
VLIFHPGQDEFISIAGVLKFRKALTFIQKQYPFSLAFGPAQSREECLESAQDVYNRLLMRTPERDLLHFETLALLTLDRQGNVDVGKARDLVKLFRPDRQGNLSVLDFVRSVDTVYKSYKLLAASIANSSRIDRAVEHVINVLYYLLVFLVVLLIFDLDPIAIILSLSSVFVSIAFMIGKASGKSPFDSKDGIAF